jgi:hypothetical protein
MNHAAIRAERLAATCPPKTRHKRVNQPFRGAVAGTNCSFIPAGVLNIVGSG